MKLEEAVSDALVATETLFKLIHTRLLQPQISKSTGNKISGGLYFDDINKLVQDLVVLAGNLHSLQLHINYALPRADNQAQAHETASSVRQTSSPPAFENTGSRSELGSLVSWTAELVQFQNKLSAAIESAPQSSLTNESPSFSWPVPIEETKRIHEIVQNAKSTIQLLALYGTVPRRLVESLVKRLHTFSI